VSDSATAPHDKRAVAANSPREAVSEAGEIVALARGLAALLAGARARR
jgi:hypothetical protein